MLCLDLAACTMPTSALPVPFDSALKVLDSWGVPKTRLVAMSGDGAALNGTAISLDNLTGKNVAAMLRRWTEHPVVAIHCAAHRLQLAVAASFKGDEFQELEDVVATLHRHLRHHPSALIDICFWSQVTSEPLLSLLSTAKTRWLSMYVPMRKLLESYLTTLSHLHYQFSFHAEKEARKTVRWMFMKLASWRTKVLLSGIVDVLALCHKGKLKLEGLGRSGNWSGKAEDGFGAVL